MNDYLKDDFEKYIEAMERFEESVCECGAKHTDFPDHHYTWCPKYKGN